ncbi:eukaryotic translation initiation factor 2 subunit 1-like [Mizuhopecten yessoensis]|uniref:eukaryotic translation initiation factor 2 subunit 1-like n=1 Tax=Mizuhopecten yessoensis TaxID=6573 RepID=UPI000B45BF24|nr:eukaryotic translation initiation factor 2 subunit 1-like [Mizuhopecten yessoensis]
MALQCRCYESRFPEQDDIVKVCVHAVGEIMADVRLIEYDNIEGMILLSELTRRRVRSVNKLVCVGRPEYVLVMRVDQEKGYIDLSKRRVSKEEADECEGKYSKAKAVNSFLCHVASLLAYDTDQQLEELYSRTAWYFDKKYQKQGASYDAFKCSVSQPELFDGCNLDTDTRDVLLASIRQKLSPKIVKVRADIEVACTGYEGVDAVRRALKKGLELTTGESPVKIHLISPPVFVVSTSTVDWQAGISKVTAVLDVIKASITEEGGLYHTDRQPSVINDTDEIYLARRLQELEVENREISGDENSDAYSDDTNDDIESCTEHDRTVIIG